MLSWHSVPSVRLHARAWQASDASSQCLQIAGQTEGTATERAFAWQLLSEPAQQVSCSLRRGTYKCLPCVCLHPTWPDAKSLLVGRAQNSTGLSFVFNQAVLGAGPLPDPRAGASSAQHTGLAAAALPHSPPGVCMPWVPELLRHACNCSLTHAGVHKAHYTKAMTAVTKLWS